MTRAELEHIVRAAAAISGDDEIVVIGSQSILGQFPDAPLALLASMEADVYPLHHPERSDLIDGSIGEGSLFHETFRYYAQGVGPGTATLPAGWQDRLIPVHSPRTRGATGLALEVHDLLISKYVAGREKDLEFTAVAVAHRMANEETLLERLGATVLPAAVADAVRARIRHDVLRAAAPGA
jgi:hypothetical protein